MAANVFKGGLFSARKRFRRVSDMAIRESSAEYLNLHSYQIAAALDHLRLDHLRKMADTGLMRFAEARRLPVLVR